MAQPHVKKMAGTGPAANRARNPNVAFGRPAPHLPHSRNTLPSLANRQNRCGNAATGEPPGFSWEEAG